MDPNAAPLWRLHGLVMLLVAAMLASILGVGDALDARFGGADADETIAAPFPRELCRRVHGEIDCRRGPEYVGKIAKGVDERATRIGDDDDIHVARVIRLAAGPRAERIGGVARGPSRKTAAASSD